MLARTLARHAFGIPRRSFSSGASLQPNPNSRFLVAAGVAAATTTALLARECERSESEYASTLLYFAGGVTTAATASRVISGCAVARRNPAAVAVAGFAAALAAISPASSLSYEEKPVEKHLAWTALNVGCGAVLSGFTGPLVVASAVVTGAAVARAAFLGRQNPRSDLPSTWPAYAVLALVMVAAPLSPGMRAAGNLIGAGVFSASGVAAFGRIEHAARRDKDYDPIAASIVPAITAANIFVYVVSFLRCFL